MRNYAALIIDIRGSRKLKSEERGVMQRRLALVIDHLNALHREQLVRDVVFSAGDEVQGLFCNPMTAYLYFRSLVILMGGHGFHGGIGLGQWETRMDNEPSTMQDGQAYHNARDAVEEAKKSKEFILVIDKKSIGLEYTVFANASLQICSMRTKVQSAYARYVDVLAPILPQYVPDYREQCCTFLNKIAREECGVRESFMPLGLIGPHVLPIYMEQFENGDFSIAAKQLSGLSYSMADYVPRSRQAIDRVMDNARIVYERTAAIAAARALGCQWGGVYA